MRRFILPHSNLKDSFIIVIFQTIYDSLSSKLQGTFGLLQLILIAKLYYGTPEKWSEIRVILICCKLLTLYWRMALANTTSFSHSLELKFQISCHFFPPEKHFQTFSSLSLFKGPLCWAPRPSYVFFCIVAIIISH